MNVKQWPNNDNSNVKYKRMRRGGARSAQMEHQKLRFNRSNLARMILPDSVADNLNHCEHIQFATALQSMNEYILHDPTVLQECGCARQTSLPGGLPVNTSQHMDTYMGGWLATMLYCFFQRRKHSVSACMLGGLQSHDTYMGDLDACHSEVT